MNENEMKQGEKRKPLYEAVMEDILTTIRDGGFTFEKPVCTENRLMKKYGVSRITARRAIGELEKQGILYSKRGVGSFVSRNIYSINKPEGSGDHRAFAFVMSYNMAESRLIDMFQSANAYLLEQGCSASVYIADRQHERNVRNTLARLADMDVAGVCYYPINGNLHIDLLENLIIMGRSVAIIDVRSNCPHIPSVVSDNMTGSKMLAEHLISLGHKRIAYLSGTSPEERSSICDRHAGYLQAHVQAGLPVYRELTRYDLGEEKWFAPASEAGGLRATILRLMEQNVTAIMAEHDQMGYHILMCCREMGIRVPEQLSVCGFDDDNWATMMYRSVGSGRITTVRQDQETIGRMAARLLYEGLQDPFRLSEPIVVPVSFVQGDTTGPAATQKN